MEALCVLSSSLTALEVRPCSQRLCPMDSKSYEYLLLADSLPRRRNNGIRVAAAAWKTLHSIRRATKTFISQTWGILPTSRGDTAMRRRNMEFLMPG